MEKTKKILLSAFGLAASCCLAVSVAAFNPVQTASANTLSDYEVQGAAVRLEEGEYGAGVAYYVVMSVEKFNEIGAIDEETGVGTLDDGYATATLLLPYNLTGGASLTPTFTASNGAKVNASDTSAFWKRVTIDETEYMQSVTYLYNIPETDFGTEISVRGCVMQNGQVTEYTAQEDHISMSYVADVEYKDENSAFDATQKESLKTTYLDKQITYYVDGVATTETVYWGEKATQVPETPEVGTRGTDNDYFMGWYTASGKPFDVTKAMKNPANVYATYQESIVLKNANGDTPAIVAVNNYKRVSTDKVEEMMLTLDETTYDLGDDPADITGATDYTAMSAAYAKHGDGELRVSFVSGETSYAVTIPVLVVTEDVSTAERFDVMRDYKGVYSSQDATGSGYYSIYGYFRITSKISRSSTNITHVNGSGTKNFRASIDGCGTAYVGNAVSVYGLFGTYMREVTIKNWTIEATNYYNHDGSSCMLAAEIHNSTIENVVLKVARVTTTHYDNAAAIQQGLLAINGANNTTFRNVTVEFGYSTNAASASQYLRSLFGYRTDGSAGEYERYGQNVYDGLYINPKGICSLEWLGTGRVKSEDGTTYTYNHVTLQDEVDDGAVIYLNGERLYKAEKATLERQNVILDGVTTASLDLGQYASEEILSITAVNGAFNLGKNPAALDVTAWTASSYDNWGAQEIVVKTQIDNNTQRIITVPVLAATKVITTADELKGFVKSGQGIGTGAYITETKYVYGYYILGGDIIDCSTAGTFAGGYNPQYFKGVFDGNGKTISNITVGSGGIFGGISGGAVKNLKVTGVTYNNASYAALFGGYVSSGATFTDVEITVKDATGVNSTNANNDGLLVAYAGGTATLTNVTIDATGFDLGVLTGINASSYKCTNVVIKADSYTNVAFDGQNKTGTELPSGITFIDTDETQA